MTIKTKDKKYLVAVYGSLMQGLHNHAHLTRSNLKGTFVTPPDYTMVDLGSFPGLYKKGGVSINMEVYEVDAHTLANIDSLECYDENNEELSMYLRTTIETPFGEAFGYIYNAPLSSNMTIVESGDWKEYYSFKKNLDLYAV
jgi:gamma-glutamylcyclotransferase (GGCT)/AIG2-like uncharacterized protein YtfP